MNAPENVTILEEDYLGGAPGGEDPVTTLRSIGHRLKRRMIARRFPKPSSAQERLPSLTGKMTAMPAVSRNHRMMRPSTGHVGSHT